jgi:hypothetical protein
MEEDGQTSMASVVSSRLSALCAKIGRLAAPE